MTTTPTLPPLPSSIDSVRCMIRGEPDFSEALDDYYTADQLRAYALAAYQTGRDAGLEEAAQRCDQSVEVLGAHTMFAKQRDALHGASIGILALKSKTQEPVNGTAL